jgi:hypothetical protein
LLEKEKVNHSVQIWSQSAKFKKTPEKKANENHLK